MSAPSEHAARDVNYWRSAYEELVKQTGRDLNDGLGLDPRKRTYAVFADGDHKEPRSDAGPGNVLNEPSQIERAAQ